MDCVEAEIGTGCVAFLLLNGVWFMVRRVARSGTSRAPNLRCSLMTMRVELRQEEVKYGSKWVLRPVQSYTSDAIHDQKAFNPAPPITIDWCAKEVHDTRDFAEGDGGFGHRQRSPSCGTKKRQKQWLSSMSLHRVLTFRLEREL
jgi:hypothetical protein